MTALAKPEPTLRVMLESAGRALLKRGVAPAPLAGLALRMAGGDAAVAHALVITINDADFPVAKQAAAYLRDLVMVEGG